MTIEELEEQIREIFIKKYSMKELERKKDFFKIEISGTYKGKSIKFFDLIKENKPIIEIQTTSYKDCFDSLIKSLES